MMINKFQVVSKFKQYIKNLFEHKSSLAANSIAQDDGDIAPAIAPQLTDYQNNIVRRKDACMDYPDVVSIETFAKCNASCKFCPHVSIERKGQKLPSELFYKIIDELSASEMVNRDLLFVLARVNEPFLDNRIYDYYKYIYERMPKALVGCFSNGSALNDKNQRKLEAARNIAWAHISLNEYRDDRYRALMGLNFRKTVANLHMLHDRVRSGSIQFPVHLSRVEDGSPDDGEFIKWCNSEFPAFVAKCTPRGDWLGAVRTKTSPIPDAGCGQWYNLNILANGRDAFCCIDANGEFGLGMDVRRHHILDIYNHPIRREMRERVLLRSQIENCRTCSMLA